MPFCFAPPLRHSHRPRRPRRCHVPLQKSIGQTTRNSPQVYPSLIVFNSRGASLQGGKLTLTGVSPNAIVFADRPVRAAGHDLTENLLEEWSVNNTNKDSFSKDPPNATVSVLSKDLSAMPSLS